jgi:Fe-S oxidoreductase/nitrate reductase gamma subunit
MTDLIPSREIYWNIRSFGNIATMYCLLLIATVVGISGIISRIELWIEGKSENKGEIFVSLKKFTKQGALQSKVVKNTVAAIFHTLIYLGFLVLLFTTTMVFIDEDLGIKIYQGDFYLWVTFFSDIFGFGLIVGVCLAIKNRYFDNNDRLHSSFADSLVLIWLLLLCIQGFILEGIRIEATDDPWKWYSPIGAIFSGLFWGFTDPALSLIHYLVWWFHTISVFLAVAIFPYTKFFHILTSPINVLFKRTKPVGAMRPIGDLNKIMEEVEDIRIGTGDITDLSWKDRLDLDACTSCGRCQEVCPAYNTIKPLSPKWVILDQRHHLLGLVGLKKLTSNILPKFLGRVDSWALRSFYLPSLGLMQTDQGYNVAGEYRGISKAIWDNTKKVAISTNTLISGEISDPNTFWSCTTCMACQEACPVGINPMEHILETRRFSALMEGSIPTEAQATLRAIETRGNPYGPSDQRSHWAKDLNIKILNPGDQIDILYWVGCVASYDVRKQKIAKALVKILNQAKINFGILGNIEGCTGDPARRLGEENLFQTQAKSNIEILKSIKFKKIVTTCPHCFNTLKNEYPEFGVISNEDVEVIHHSVLINQLLANNTIKVNDTELLTTFHDPCYLGRGNGIYEDPRSAIKKIKGLKIIEMEDNRAKGMCCGAGGGHFWMDLKLGERINSKRVEQATLTKSEVIATACPFCMQMMEDGVKLKDNGVKLKDKEGDIKVLDIAELVAENLIV